MCDEKNKNSYIFRGMQFTFTIVILQSVCSNKSHESWL